jgi:hypothetical protein
MRPILLCLALLISLLALSQKEKGRSVELSLLGRYELYGDFITRYGDRSYVNETKIAGLSLGLNAAVRQPLTRHLSTKLALGYYRLGINEVRQSTPFGIVVKGRNFEDVRDSVAILYSATKYHYNTLALSAGLQVAFPMKRSSLTMGADVVYYFTYSQRYHRENRPAYKTSNFRTLGWGVNAQAGWLKQLGDFYIHPQVLLPVYQVLRGDPVFKEDERLKIHKWFNGVGAIITVGKYL